MGHPSTSKPASSFQLLTSEVMEIETGGESEPSLRKIRWRTWGASCRSPAARRFPAGPLKTQFMPRLSRLHRFHGNPPFCSHYLLLHSFLIIHIVSLILPFEPLHLLFALPGKLTPTPSPFSIFILFVSAPTEAWTTHFKVTAPKSYSQCCCHFLHVQILLK